MTEPFIPVNEPLLDGNEEAYLVECVRSGWVSSEGPFVARFEAEFAARVGRRHGVAVANGSLALDAAFAALRLSAGDEVIMPTFTIISCATAVLRAGGTPVLVDCDPLTWNMRPEEVEARIGPRTRAILVVHIFGLPVDMDPILELAQAHGLDVVEDAAEMHGQTYRGRPCGSFGVMSTFSFYSNKLVTTGEGGMVLTNDDRIADRLRDIRNLFFQPKQRFVHEELGWNYRMTNLQAALGVAQLERLDRTLERKRRIGRLYNEHLAGVPHLQLPLASINTAESIYWVYGVVLDDALPLDAREAMALLARAGIGTRPFFWPMHEQPALRRLDLFFAETHPVAERIARRGFYLPSGLALRDDQIKRVADRVHDLIIPATG